MVAAAAAVQWSALGQPFFADDYLFLDQVRHRSLVAALTSPDPIGNFFRPVGRQLWFWLIARLGESPGVAHAMNLSVFLGIVALLFATARRFAGTTAGAIAAALVALSYAADVPVRWVSGSQDLLAVLGALAALWLFASGRRAWAALALAIALLSKETVVLTPLVAALAARRPGERWTRTFARAWPLGLVVVAIACVWATEVARAGGAARSLTAGAIPAALVHLVQVGLGAEWSRGDPLRILRTPPQLVPLALALIAVLLAARSSRRVSPGRGAGISGDAAKRSGASAPDPAAAGRLGLAWALAAALPVAAVAPVWSAYYYLFAWCGLGLALGALLARAPRVAALAVVALLAWGSENGRRLEEFATGPGAWTAQSHVNRLYIDRALRSVSRYLEDLRRQRPELPPRSTLFFAGVPAYVAWQAADGPLVRWAYRDSSLRSYFLAAFSLEKARRGPFFVFDGTGDSLKDLTGDPELLRGMTVALLLADHPDAARDPMALELERDPGNPTAHYWMAWIELARGDTAAFGGHLRDAGAEESGGARADLTMARERLVRGDREGAGRLFGEALGAHPLDPSLHAAVADLLFEREALPPTGVIEALAARLLAPQDPGAWRRWAFYQARSRRYDAALPSLRRYVELAGPAVDRDPDARQLLEFLVRAQPGGELAQKGLRTGMAGRR